jgi:hypothetical protein
VFKKYNERVKIMGYGGDKSMDKCGVKSVGVLWMGV